MFTKITLFMKIAPHLITYWRLTLIAVLSTVVWYQNFSTELYWDVPTIPSIATQLVESKDQLQVSIDGNAKLTASLDKRNEEIAEWKATTSVLETQNEVLSSKIELVGTTTKSRVARRLRQPAPSNCAAAFKLLAEGTGELTWEE